MKVRVYIATLVIFVVSIGAAGSAANASPLRFVAGQEWSIKSRVPTTAKIIIDRVEPWHGKTVVQLSVIDVPIPQGLPGAGGRTTIGHMPFEESAVAASVKKLLAKGVPPPPDFESGYKKWQADKRAGIYTITVAEAIQALFESLFHGRS